VDAQHKYITIRKLGDRLKQAIRFQFSAISRKVCKERDFKDLKADG
jgi:hypothetical protein